MKLTKPILPQIEAKLAENPLDERVKDPVYLQLIATRVTTRMAALDRFFGQQSHTLTSLSGHFANIEPQKELAAQ